MADLDAMTPGQILADSSVADFIKELGLGIAAAQTALDDNSVRQIEVFTARRDDLGGRSLLDLGLSPAFYHYQHADISCAMQIRMEVGTSDEFGFGVSTALNDRSESSDSSDSASDSVYSSSSAQSGTQTARLSMATDSQAVLKVQGHSAITPVGATPAEKLTDLQKTLASANGAVDRLVFTPPTTGPPMALKNISDKDKVVVQSPTVTFLKPDVNAALVQITTNADTDFTLSSTGTVTTVTTTAKADLTAYAEHVRDQFDNAGFTSTMLKPGQRVEIASCLHDTGVQEPESTSVAMLERLALLLKQVPSQTIEIEGYTDRQGPAAANVALGEARATTVRDIIVSHGVPINQVAFASPPSQGEKAAADAGDVDDSDNADWRTTKLYIPNLVDHWVLVQNGPTIDTTAIDPNGIGQSLTSNAFIAVAEPQALSLSGNSVVIDGTDFPFKGGAVAGSAAGSGEAYARNLTADINASATHRAWSVGNVVWVAATASTFAVQLFSSAAELVVVETGEFTVTEQFRRSSSSVKSQDRDRKRTVAVGVSVSARFSRQFNMEVTGNSSISARLVSVPAPPEFLEQIAAYQNSLNP